MSLHRLIIVLLGVVLSYGQFHWQTRDSFDEIRQRIDKVTADNCKIVDINELFLPQSSVTHIPDLKWLGIDPIFPNRTNLLHIHNMALSRAFYLSYILQKVHDDSEPGFMYYFLSAISDVAANRFINASSIYYGPNMAFTPSYKGFFNKTMPLFAPRAFRADDFNDPYHLQGTSTLNTIEAIDLGAIHNNSVSVNYTHEQYKINEWYRLWLPDLTKRHDSKTTYTVQITYKNGTNETFVFHGPPSAADFPGPVKWFKPYFDCKRSNKWVYGASVPIPDIFPRHTGWRHIEIPINVAVAVMEIDFERIDINQCPHGEGNPPLNHFAGTARCKNVSTECEPIHGFGFRRGGYQCRCKPGFRLPKVVRTPYLGEMVERATQNEYDNGFHCDRIGYIAVRTQNVVPIEQYDRRKLIARTETLTGLYGNMSTSTRYDPNWVTDHMKSAVNAQNCHLYAKNDPWKLKLRGDVAYNKEIQLENEARMALRLANFISAFLQLVDPKEQFAEFRVPDKPLTQDQIIGEALATVIGDRKIQGCGVFFDYNQFNTTYFAPYAYRLERNTQKFFVDDMSRHHEKTDKFYVNHEYFTHLKNRWASNTDDLETYTTKINIRYNSTGLYGIHYDHYPLQYKAAEIRHGYWTAPYFDCGGFHNQWILTYAAPFFGWDKIKSRLEFKGVVAVNVRLEELDINQCGDDYQVPNAFKNTHKCDRLSSRCVPILGRRFYAGGYKCECEQGYEYPFNDPITYFDGQILEAEYTNMVQDTPSRYDTLMCRIAKGSRVTSFSVVTLLLISFLVYVID